jgi:hypothetical protein
MFYPTQTQDTSEVIIQGKALAVISPPRKSRWCPLQADWPLILGQDGDSGCLVFDYRGKVLGMYVGGQGSAVDSGSRPPVKTPCVDGIHFVSPIVSIFDSIRAAAQADPSFDGLPVDVEFL